MPIPHATTTIYVLIPTVVSCPIFLASLLSLSLCLLFHSLPHFWQLYGFTPYRAATTSGLCTHYNFGDGSSCTAQPRTDASDGTCIFAAAGSPATCTDPDGGTTCNTHNANEATCTTKPRTDAAGATCVLIDSKTLTACASHNNDRATCVSHNDASGTQCSFDSGYKYEGVGMGRLVFF